MASEVLLSNVVRLSCFLQRVKFEGGFLKLKELKTREHMLYMSDNSFCAELGTGSVRVQLENGDNLV